jgi:hypothetical protein
VNNILLVGGENMENTFMLDARALSRFTPSLNIVELSGIF